MRSANILISTLILTLQFLNTNTLTEEEYYKNQSGPKCCTSGSHYTLINDTLTCTDTYINYIYQHDDTNARRSQEVCNTCLDAVSGNENPCNKCARGASEVFCSECMQILKNLSAPCNDCLHVIAHKSENRTFCGGCSVYTKTCHDCKSREMYTNCENCDKGFEQSCSKGCEQLTESVVLHEFHKFCNSCAEESVLKNVLNDCFEIMNEQVVKLDYKGNYKVLQERYYPKCCPIGSQYDTVEHKCVRNESLVQKYFGYTRVDLSNCNRVIVDYLDVVNYTIDPDYLDVTVKFENVEGDSDNFLVKKILENSSKRVFKYGDYCWDENYATGGNVLRACVSYNICKSEWNPNGITCLPKCCADGHHFLGGCRPTYTYGIHSRNLSLYKDFAVFRAKKAKKFISSLTDAKLDEFGVLSAVEKVYPNTKYCLEYHEKVQKIFLYSDNEPAVENVKMHLKKILVSISCIFLFLTIVCYLILAEMRENLYGKCVVIYCSIFLLAFILLAYVAFKGHIIDRTQCFVIGFVLLFSLVGTFSWLNIICFDMWMAFGQIRVRTLRTKKNDCKKLMYYNLYGWGVPTTITLITFGMNQAFFMPDYLKPNIGRMQCFIENESGNYSHLVYFILPLSILVISNLVLFLKTISYCFKVKDEINKMIDTLPSEKAKRNKSLNADKEKLAMMIKLFVIMGISWLFEIMTSFVSFKENVLLSYIELIVDCLNSLQGVFIFCILLVKKKVLNSLKNKVCPKLIRRPSESSTTMTSVYSYIRNKDHVNANRNVSETRR